MNNNRARIANSVKHGINRIDILPCKKEKCFYAELCNISDLFCLFDYGAPCPIEVLKAQEMADSYKADLSHVENDKKNVLIRDLIITDLQKQRVENTIAISGTMFSREDKSIYPILPNVVLRYYREISARNTKLLFQAKELKQQFLLQTDESTITDNEMIQNLDSKKFS